MASRIVVIKVGSSVLASEKGMLNEERLLSIASFIHSLKQDGWKPVLVSSGAVAAGFSRLGLSTRPRTTHARQAAAAAGQGVLMQAWQKALDPYELVCAQVLLTQEDFVRRQSFQNALATFEYLLSKSALPIVNENDTIATEELTFGDNDMLAALVAAFLKAEHLLLFTSVDAVYKGDPLEDPQAERIDALEEVPSDLIQSIGTSSSSLGTGGMQSKLLAASLAQSLGVSVYIGSGFSLPASAADLLDGKSIGTRIRSRDVSQSRKKQWIALHAESSATLVVDTGAANALIQGRNSLLAVGVMSYTSEFKEGEVLIVSDESGRMLGKGIARVAAESLGTSGELHSRKKDMIVIHRNDWVALSGTYRND